MTNGLRIAIVCLMGTVSFTGCASVFDSSGKSASNNKKKEGWSFFKKKEYQEPRSMTVIWSEDVLVVAGKPPTRGFGGRIYFYNERSQAVPVDGELTVYGFDDTEEQNARTEPDKRFKFTSEQFTKHFSQGDLGASYSVWIPWDEAGGPHKKVTLIPTFTTKDGRLVRGEATKTALSGKSNNAGTMVRNQTNRGSGPGDEMVNRVQLASASVPTVDANQTLPRMGGEGEWNNKASSIKTTTIKMSRPVGGMGNPATPMVNPYSGFSGMPPSTTAPSDSPTTTSSSYPGSTGGVSNAAGASMTAPSGEGSQAVQVWGQANQPNPQAGWIDTPSQTTGIPALGQNIPVSGWIQPERLQQGGPQASFGYPPNQYQAPTLPAAR